MTTISEALAIAARQYQAGRLDAAEQMYRQILNVDPNQAEAWHVLGLIEFQTGMHEPAVEHIRRAIQLNAADSVLYSNLASVLQAQGKLDDAVAAHRRAVELAPHEAEAHYNLGTALQAGGNLDEAVVAYRRALERNPQFAEAHSNLGTCFSDLERFDHAAAAFQRALELKPSDAKGHFNLGNAFQAQKKLAEAVSCFRRALELTPHFAEAWNNLGNTLRELKDYEESAACYRRALGLRPNYAEAHNNLGAVLEILQKLDEAVGCYRRALELKPEYAEAWNNLGNAFKDRGQINEAIDCFRRALALRPDYFAAHRNLLYSLWFCPGLDAAAIHDEHRRWNEQWAKPLANQFAPHANDKSPGRRLRIGYVSPDFRTHCQAFFTVPLLAAHDRQQFEIVCYADVARPDGTTDRLRACADHWRDITGLNDQELAQLIRQDQIDILVDLTMHMERGHLLAFARQPAPVQVCWLAYPGTTGLKAIDYRLTDPYLDPPGLNDEHYAERSIRLNDCFWCYDPLTDGPAVSSLPATANGHVTFGCLNNFCKVNPAVLELWAGVLKAVERSQLVLLAPEGSARENVLKTLEKSGISRDRLTFTVRQPRATYLELYHQIDIGLDTFPYNGHTTSLDSFWMGVPVITLVGQTVVGRAGLCQLQNLGLSELIAHTPDQFIKISADLAGDLPRLSQLRAGLRTRMEQSPLMDAPRFARSMEAAYRSMWEAWCGKAI